MQRKQIEGNTHGKNQKNFLEFLQSLELRGREFLTNMEMAGIHRCPHIRAKCFCVHMDVGIDIHAYCRQIILCQVMLLHMGPDWGVCVDNLEGHKNLLLEGGS